MTTVDRDVEGANILELESLKPNIEVDHLIASNVFYTKNLV